MVFTGLPPFKILAEYVTISSIFCAGQRRALAPEFLQENGRKHYRLLLTDGNSVAGTMEKMGLAKHAKEWLDVCKASGIDVNTGNILYSLCNEFCPAICLNIAV
jgi:hypothetical protein